MASTLTIPASTRTWAEIDLPAIRHNLTAVRRKIGPGPEIMAVVKADAYGHGAQAVAEAIREDVTLFGVANQDEAEPLAGLGRDLLLLGPCLPGERADAVARNLIVTISSAAEAEAYGRGTRVRINLKVDTGMGRIGCWRDEATAEIEELLRSPNLDLQSISTHLPSADEDPDFTRRQLDHFTRFARTIREKIPLVKFHALNSAGVLEFPEFALDLVRPGLMLYGSAYPSDHQPLLRPALTWKTRITLLREVPAGRSVSYGRSYVTPGPQRIATLAVGYADGLPRQASGRDAAVLIGGVRCPVLGRVTMDQTLVDISAVPGAEVGQEAVLIGRQGTEEILAAELAEKAGTISWAIFTGLGPRVKRVFLTREDGVFPPDC